MRYNVKSIVAAAAIGFGMFGMVGCTIRNAGAPVSDAGGSIDSAAVDTTANQGGNNKAEAREDGRYQERQSEAYREQDHRRADASDSSDQRSDSAAPQEETSRRDANATAEGEEQAQTEQGQGEQAAPSEQDGQATTDADAEPQAKSDADEQPGAEGDETPGPQSRATVNGVIKWWSDGERESDILRWIDRSGSDINLSARDVKRLREEAVSPVIINRMKQQHSHHASTAE